MLTIPRLADRDKAKTYAALLDAAEALAARIRADGALPTGEDLAEDLVTYLRKAAYEARTGEPYYCDCHAGSRSAHEAEYAARVEAQRRADAERDEARRRAERDFWK
jgi:hypothetical protein